MLNKGLSNPNCQKYFILFYETINMARYCFSDIGVYIFIIKFLPTKWTACEKLDVLSLSLIGLQLLKRCLIKMESAYVLSIIMDYHNGIQKCTG